MNVLIALIVAYLIALAVFSLIARPHRVRLNRLLNELAADYGDNPFVMDLCGHFASTAYAWRAAPMKFFAYMVFMMVPGDVLDEKCREADLENPNILDDARIHEAMDSYDASIAAVNPIFGSLMYAAEWAFRAKAVLHHRGKSGRKLTDYVGMRAAT